MKRGDFRVPIQIARAKGERFEPLRVVVDTGSTFTWVPRDVLERLGVSPEQEGIRVGRRSRTTLSGGVSTDQSRGARGATNDCRVRTARVRTDPGSCHIRGVPA